MCHEYDDPPNKNYHYRDEIPSVAILHLILITLSKLFSNSGFFERNGHCHIHQNYTMALTFWINLWNTETSFPLTSVGICNEPSK